MNEQELLGLDIDSLLNTLEGRDVSPEPMAAPTPSPLPSPTAMDESSILESFGTGLSKGASTVLDPMTYINAAQTLGDVYQGMKLSPVSTFRELTKDITLENALETIGREGTGFAGAAKGAGLGSALGPVGTLLGGALGYGASTGLVDYIYELGKVSEPTTPEQKAEVLGERLSGAALGDALTGGSIKLAKKAAGVPLALSEAKRRLVGPATERQAMQEVGDTLRSMGVTSKQIDKAQMQARSSMPTTSEGLTTAELLERPDLRALEQAIPSNLPEKQGAYAVQKKEMQDIRQENVKGLIPEGYELRKGEAGVNINRADAGKQVKQELTKAKATSQQKVSEAYGALPRTIIPKKKLVNFKGNLSKKRNEIFGKDRLEAPDEPVELTKKFEKLNNAIEQRNGLSPKTLQSYYSEFAALARQYRSLGYNDVASVATHAQNEIRKVLERGGRTSRAWRKANELGFAHAKTFYETAIDDVLRKKKKPEAIIDTILNDTEAINNFVNVAYDTNAHKAVKAFIVDDILTASAKGDTTVKRYLQAGRDDLKKIFGPEANALEGQIRDIERRTSVEKAANPTIGPNTAAKMTPAIQRTFGKTLGMSEGSRLGELGANIGAYLGSSLGGLGAVAGSIFGRKAGTTVSRSLKQSPQLILGDSIYKALMNPNYAKKAIKESTTAAGQKRAAKVKLLETREAMTSAREAVRPVTPLVASALGQEEETIVPQEIIDYEEQVRQSLTTPFETMEPSATETLPPEETNQPEVKEQKISFEPLEAVIFNAASVDELIKAQPPIIQAMIEIESRGNPKARSKAGALGLLQLMPGTAKAMGIKNPLDPKQNIRGGTQYFNEMLTKFNNDTELALAAYNWGPGNLRKAIRYLEEKNIEPTWENMKTNLPAKKRGEWGLPKETSQYVGKVIAAYRKFSI